MKQRTLHYKELPVDDRELRALLAEIERLIPRLPAPSATSPKINRQIMRIASMLDKKRMDLCVLKNKTKATARTFYFTVFFEPKPWLLDVVRALRTLARNRDRKVKRRR
jgi:hypothetical protein